MKGQAMTTKAPTPTAKKPEPKLTRFRVHYRTSVNAKPQTHDCDAEDIGGAHTATRLHVGDADVRVFIDMVKVRKGA